MVRHAEQHLRRRLQATCSLATVRATVGDAAISRLPWPSLATIRSGWLPCAAMPQPKNRRLPQVRDVPWQELRRRATIIFLWLQAGWTSLAPEEREEVRELVSRSRGRPNNLTRTETRRLAALAAKAANAAARRRRI
jgi:hypothetical protein